MENNQQRNNSGSFVGLFYLFGIALILYAASLCLSEWNRLTELESRQNLQIQLPKAVGKEGKRT